MCQKNKVLHRIKFNQEISTKLPKTMHQLSINLLCSSDYRTTYSFCEIKHFVKQAKSLLILSGGYFWKISRVSSLVFLSWEFALLYFLQIWFIISERGDMSNFMGVGMFWIGFNRADLGCWRLTLRRFPYLLFWRETCPQTFPLSSCQYVSTILEKKLHGTGLPKIDNCARNIYTILQNKRRRWLGAAPTDNIWRQILPQQTIHRWKGNLTASGIHFKYWTNI